MNQKIDKHTDWEAEYPLPDLFASAEIQIHERTEFSCLAEFSALAGHLFPRALVELVWERALSWLWKAERNPRLGELRFALREIEKEKGGRT